MTGWRLGVAIGPKEVIEKMGLVIQTIVSCVPPFIQLAGIEAIKGDQTLIVKMMAEYQKRRDVLVAGLNDIPGIKCVKPEGALYVFPNIANTGMSSEEFADFALEKAGVALLPGSNFGEHGQGFVRLCYVNTLENIELAIKKLAHAIKER
jgi:aspartate/methionine/tyrosine aminotransferase